MNEITLSEIKQKGEIKIARKPFTTYVSIMEGRILNVTVWKEWEQYYGGMNRDIVYMMKYEVSESGLSKAKRDYMLYQKLESA